MTSTQVARLSESDWQLFAVVRLRALSDALGADDPQYRQEASFTVAQWRRRLRDHAQFVAFVDGRAVGLVGAQQENLDSVYVYSLWLDPKVRGQGLARPLVAAAVDWARQQRVRTVRLRVASDNARARGVYESLGFTIVASENVEDTEELAMSLSLSVS